MRQMDAAKFMSGCTLVDREQKEMLKCHARVRGDERLVRQTDQVVEEAGSYVGMM